jgi:hypothetical protein
MLGHYRLVGVDSRVGRVWEAAGGKPADEAAR